MITPRPSLVDIVADRLREKILLGELALGAKLHQDYICREFGVSRTPLRQALARLEAEGLIETENHKSAVVRRPSRREMIELYEIADSLEPLAAKLALPRRDGAVLEDLTSLLTRLEGTDDIRAWTTLNSTFHMTMYLAADRPLLCETISMIRNRTALYVQMTSLAARREQAEAEHRRILQAYKTGNEAKLIDEVRQHLRGTVDMGFHMLADR